MDLSKAKELSINGQPVVMLQVGDVILWKKGGEREWKLDEDGALLGEDGKYYQRLYDDSEMVDNNPVPDLNSQWVVDTVSGALNIDKNFDYYMSNSNYHVGNGYAQFKVTWSGLESVTFLYRSDAESNFDYLVINGLDKPAFTSIPSNSTSGIIAHTSGKQTTTYYTLKIDTPDKGEHFIWICYRKDSSVDSNSDRAFVGIPNNYKSGKIIEKQGAELRYEYLQSTDYVPSEREGYIRYKYYKTYFSPNNAHQFSTDEYILGEEVPTTPITANYLRFDAVDNPVHIGFNNLSLATDMEYSVGFEETFMSFPADGVDIPQGKSIWLRASGLSTNVSARTFTTSAPVECHGNVKSLLRKDNFTSTSLTYSCFNSLFKDTHITTVPEISATSLTNYCFKEMFRGCAGLTSLPNNLLPATTLKQECYSGMFTSCTGLTTLPEGLLPATTLNHGCYSSMFASCTGLVSIPEKLLPATNLYAQCYNSMFYNCTGLTSLPEKLLPATKLMGYCYQSMFYNCTGLTSLPEKLLPATTLANNCYYQMFQGCTSLTSAPELPATTLVDSCYHNMFQGCTSLTSAPELPAKTLVNNCYYQMFYGCSQLNYVKAMFTTTPENLSDYTGQTKKWLNGVATTGTFVKYESVVVSRGVDGIPEGWNVEYIPITPITANYLRFDAVNNPVHIGISDVGSVFDLEYSKGTEDDFTLFTSSGVDLAQGESIWLRANGISESFASSHTFTTSATVECHGDVRSLLGKTNFTSKPLTRYCFMNLFANTKITTVPELPATSLSSMCYSNMFQGCINLVSVPEKLLPAKTLTDNCYNSMFQGCTSLTSAPELPATSLTTNAYKLMFKGCTSLTYIKISITSSWNTSWTVDWVTNVASSGTFVKPADTSIPTGTNGIPDGWTVEAA